MKRMIIVILALLICMAGCSSDQAAKSNPLRIASAVVEADGEEMFIQYQYNEAGLLQKETQFENGEVVYSVAYEYDALGNMSVVKFLHSDGSMSSTEYFYTMDEENRIIYKESCYDTELADCLEISYDKNGRETKLVNTIIKPGKDEVITTDMTYDNDGRLIMKVVQWSNDPSMGGTTTYQYEKDRLTCEEVLAPAGWTKNYIEYSYDDTGLLQTAMEFNGNGKLQSKAITRSDAYGNVVNYEYYRHTDNLKGSGDEIADRVVTNTYEKIPE